MRVTYARDVRAEVVDAIKYYQRTAPPGIAQALMSEAKRTIKGVIDRPLRWRRVSGEFRRALLKDFPYCIIYRVDEDGLYITAFMHMARRPGYWEGREG